MIHQRCKDVVRHVNGVSKILDGVLRCFEWFYLVAFPFEAFCGMKNDGV